MMLGAAEIVGFMVPGPGNMVNFVDGNRTLQIPCTPISKVIYAHMDGTTSLRALRQRIMAAVPGATPAPIERELELVYNQLHPRGYLYLLRAGSYGAMLPDYARLASS